MGTSATPVVPRPFAATGAALKTGVGRVTSAAGAEPNIAIRNVMFLVGPTFGTIQNIVFVLLVVDDVARGDRLTAVEEFSCPAGDESAENFVDYDNDVGVGGELDDDPVEQLVDADVGHAA
jgi:hypothetical protein